VWGGGGVGGANSGLKRNSEEIHDAPSLIQELLRTLNLSASVVSVMLTDVRTIFEINDVVFFFFHPQASKPYLCITAISSSLPFNENFWKFHFSFLSYT
jgi:hypothetical protein